MKPICHIIFLMICLGTNAQVDNTLFRRVPVDTIGDAMNMDAVYNRPFLQFKTSPVSVGGYLEADYQYIGEDGITEGHSFSIPRMTLFFSAAINSRIKFLSEIELEEGGKTIAIEFAAVDFNFHPLFNLRGGIIMNPIGAFNQNHDGPKWEFNRRPIAATEMLPATWSNVGFGLYGKYYQNNWAFGYEIYATNGFDQTIIDNPINRTSLSAAKENFLRFEESGNGHPLFTAKTAIRNNRIGEIGLSYMGGIFNQPVVDGIRLDQKRKLDVVAIDFNTRIGLLGTSLVGEWAWIWVDVPSSYSQQYGNRQYGGFIDIIQPIVKKTILGFSNSTLNLALRLEYVDWNVGEFNETGTSIGEEIWAFVPAISFRPGSQTVIRLNYRQMRKTDILGNPPARISGIEFGISTYF